MTLFPTIPQSHRAFFVTSIFATALAACSGRPSQDSPSPLDSPSPVVASQAPNPLPSAPKNLPAKAMGRVEVSNPEPVIHIRAKVATSDEKTTYASSKHFPFNAVAPLKTHITVVVDALGFERYARGEWLTEQRPFQQHVVQLKRFSNGKFFGFEPEEFRDSSKLERTTPFFGTPTSIVFGRVSYLPPAKDRRTQITREWITGGFLVDEDGGVWKFSKYKEDTDIRYRQVGKIPLGYLLNMKKLKEQALSTPLAPIEGAPAMVDHTGGGSNIRIYDSPRIPSATDPTLLLSKHSILAGVASSRRENPAALTILRWLLTLRWEIGNQWDVEPD